MLQILSHMTLKGQEHRVCHFLMLNLLCGNDWRFKWTGPEHNITLQQKHKHFSHKNTFPSFPHSVTPLLDVQQDEDVSKQDS